MAVEASPVVRFVKSVGCALPLAPAPTVTSTQGNKSALPVMGGTGANSVMLGFADAIWFSDPNGNPATPPHNEVVFQGTPDEGTVDEIENPNPSPSTNNWYTEDGYGGGGFGSPVFGGGTYSNCFDPNAPGVGPVLNYLASLKKPINPNCDPGHYYLLNNYNPGYFGD